MLSEGKSTPHADTPFHADNSGGKAGLYINMFCVLLSSSALSILHLLF